MQDIEGEVQKLLGLNVTVSGLRCGSIIVDMEVTGSAAETATEGTPHLSNFSGVQSHSWLA
jgi:hypothetical protein